MSLRKKELIRITSNYGRLLLTFVSGLVVLRLSLSMGEELFAVFVLVTVGLGLSSVFTQLLQMTFQPTFGFLMGGEQSDEQTTEVFSSSFLVSCALAVIGALIYLGLGFYVTDLATSTTDSVIWTFVVFRASVLVVFTVLMPGFSLLLVTGRQLGNNMFMTIPRLSEALAFAIPYFLFDSRGEALLLSFTFASGVFQILFYLLVFGFVSRLDKRFRFSVRSLRMSAALTVLGKLRHGFWVVVSMNLYSRFGVFVVSVFFGTAGTLVFGVTMQIVGYLRQLMMGLVLGLEAVFNQISRTPSRKDQDAATRRSLLASSSFIQASISFVVSAFILAVANDIVLLLIGDSVANPEQVAEQAGMIISVMIIGMAARNLTEGWRQALIGAGFAHLLPKAVLPGAIINIALVLTLLNLLPEDMRSIMVVAYCYSLSLALVHLPLMTRAASRAFELGVGALFRPFLIPAIIALVGLALMLILGDVLDQQSWWKRVMPAVVVSMVATIVLGAMALKYLKQIGADDA